jgi:hypothetical protein
MKNRLHVCCLGLFISSAGFCADTDPLAASLQQKAYQPSAAGSKLCAANAKLSGNAAVLVADTERVVALLDCEGADAHAPTIIALFDKNKLDAPLCAAKLALTDAARGFFLPKTKSIAARAQADKSVFVAVESAGGESNDSWRSHSVARLDSQCALTPLTRVYTRMHYDEDNSAKCEGAKHTATFVGNARFEVRTDNIHCTPTDEKVETSTKELDLDALLRKPEARVFEPR